MSGKNNSRASQRSEEIYMAIRDRIYLLVYPPGMQLKETELATEFNVSRSPIRQVLARLQSDGLILTRHGAGTFITNIKLQELMKVYELRIRLADLIGELTPVPATDKDVEDWKELLEKIDQLEKRPDRTGYAQLVSDFHQLILNRTGNEMLRKIDDQLFYLTSRVWVSYTKKEDWMKDLSSIRFNVNQILLAIQNEDLRGIGLAYRNAITAGVKLILNSQTSMDQL